MGSVPKKAISTNCGHRSSYPGHYRGQVITGDIPWLTASLRTFHSSKFIPAMNIQTAACAKKTLKTLVSKPGGAEFVFKWKFESPRSIPSNFRLNRSCPRDFSAIWKFSARFKYSSLWNSLTSNGISLGRNCEFVFVGSLRIRNGDT